MRGKKTMTYEIITAAALFGVLGILFWDDIRRIYQRRKYGRG